MSLVIFPRNEMCKVHPMLNIHVPKKAKATAFNAFRSQCSHVQGAGYSENNLKPFVIQMHQPAHGKGSKSLTSSAENTSMPSVWPIPTKHYCLHKPTP